MAGSRRHGHGPSLILSLTMVEHASSRTGVHLAMRDQGLALASTGLAGGLLLRKVRCLSQGAV